MTNFKLKDILNIPNLKAFFIEYRDFFKKFFYSRNYYLHIKSVLNKFILCRDPSNNYVKFSCTCCSHYIYRPITCKSRICPSCGKNYSEQLTNRFLTKAINKRHRHILFTLPNYSWNLFIGKYHMLSILADKLYLVFKEYYKANNIEYFAFSVFFHTFGRDLKFNPHMHIIISEGGFDSNFKWKKLAFFPPEKFANPWKFIIYKTLKDNLQPSSKLNSVIKKIWSKNSNLFFNVKGQTLYNIKSAIKYLGRYLARAPISEYKISDINEESITFWFKNLKSSKKEYLTLPINKLIGRIITHIQPKYFKMVRHFGIYARNINKKLKEVIINMRIKAIQSKKLSWHESIYRWINFNPLICPNCHIELIISEIKYNKKYYRFNN